MDFQELRDELSDFYANRLHDLHTACTERCKDALDREISEKLPAIRQKSLQYRIIAENLTPVIYRHTALFCEVCANEARETPFTAGLWTYQKNRELYREYGASVLAEKKVCAEYPLYTFCGEFGDEYYHFAIENEKILRMGFRGVYEKVCARLEESDLREDERDWLLAVREGILAVKRVGERFAALASDSAKRADGEDERNHYLRIAETAARIPWEAPQTFYEALEAIVFIQGVIPMLEGGGLYSVGRLDVLLYDFYLRDLESGRLTQEDAYRLICEFLLLNDLRIPHDQPDQRDSLISAVYTLGGCDADGAPVFNELTELFLRADREQEIIYPKIKCRFNASSPAAYLDRINETLRSGKSTLLYVNDDALIPAFIRAGVSERDARGYSVLGCWEPVIPRASNEHCAYLSLIKILELSVNGGLRRAELPFEIRPLSDAASFEDVLSITIANIHAVMESRARVAVTARRHWSKIDPHPLISSVLDDCLEHGRDLTEGGAKYNFDEIICTGLPNVVDSLLVIRELCFEKKKYSLDELLTTVQNNWDMETIRQDALACHFFGDESEESNFLAKQITDDIAAYAETLPALWNDRSAQSIGRVTVGYMLFMEMYRWAPTLRATPDGRHDGDYFSRGLTPSALHKINSVTSVINSCRAIDGSGIAADSVLNLTLPYAHIPLPVWEALVREAARTGVGALQLNCATREELLDAKVHPERHNSLIVRVCGYSARFTSLPEDVQDEFLDRNVFSK